MVKENELESPGTVGQLARTLVASSNVLVNVYREAYDQYVDTKARTPHHTKLREALINAVETLEAVNKELRGSTNRLLLCDVWSEGDRPLKELCNHCHTDPQVAKGICRRCYNYKRRFGELPSSDVLRNRDFRDRQK